MDSKTFFENFETIANAPGGVSRLRELILDLAIRGRLLPTDESISRDDDCFPDHWKRETIEDAAEYVQRGKGPKYAVKSNVPVISQKCVKWPGFDISEARFIEPSSLPSYREERFLRNGDLLWNSTGTGTVGRTALFIESAEFNIVVADSHVTVIRAPKIQPEFLWIWSASPTIQTEVLGSTTGSTNQQELNLSTIKALSIYLPPIDEQKKIAAKVDELMTLCDELEAAQTQRGSLRTSARKSAIDSISTATIADELSVAWKRINQNWTTFADTPQSITSLRFLILDLAVRGSLVTANNDSDDIPILTDYVKLKLDDDKLWQLPTALPEPSQGWSRVPLARVGQWGSGGTPTASRKEFYNNGTIPWAVIGDLNNSVMLTTESLITKKALETSSTKMIPIGAVLVAMYGASIGKTAINGLECCTNQAIAHCVVDDDVIASDYLFLVVKSLKSHLIEMGKGAAQPNISQSVLKHLVIDIPPKRIQKLIIERTDELLRFCDGLESALRERQSLESSLAKTMTRFVAA